MTKHAYISVLVDWAPDDITTLNSYGDTGYRFVYYTNSTPVYAVFEKTFKIEDE